MKHAVWYTFRQRFEKARERHGADFYRGTAKQDEQGGYALFVEDHAGASPKTGRNAAEAGNKDTAPGRENKGTGIPERDAF